MLGQIYAGKVCSCVESGAHHTAEADEAVEHSLHIGGIFRNEASAAEKLKHIPQVGENDGKDCLYKFRGVAVKHTPHAPDKKQKSADPPGYLMTLAQGCNSVKFFHSMDPFKSILKYYNIILVVLPQIRKIF